MKVLVTGGTGVVGGGAVTVLLQRGHSVRLLSRGATEDVRQWSQGVTPWPADVAVEAAVTGAADGCDAVLHLAAISDESPPDATFQRINVDGTRHIVREAQRAGVGRLVYVSSLGAEGGGSGYQKSKREGERIVEGFGGNWTIVRPGAVYGPGDEHLSVLLRLFRSLPAIPVIGDGRHRFQPLWHEDLAEALAATLERQDLAGRTLEVAGREVTSQRDLVERLRELTGRSPILVPVPDAIASLGLRALEIVGVAGPFTRDQLTMLREGNTIDDGAENALGMLGVRATSLDDGLARLADAAPEQLPDEGHGTLHRKRFWADIAGSRYDADGLATQIRDRFGEMMPSLVNAEAEPDTPTHIELGETLTLGLPLRGNVQVRVAEVTPRAFTLVTLDGHPLAGAVRFLVEERGDRLRFETQIYARAANVVDLVIMRTVGEWLQDATWRELVHNVVAASGGTTEAVESDEEPLDDAQAKHVDAWLRDLIQERRRDEAGV